MAKLKTFRVSFSVYGTASVEVSAINRDAAYTKAKREYEEMPLDPSEIDDPTYGEPRDVVEITPEMAAQLEEQEKVKRPG